MRAFMIKSAILALAALPLARGRSASQPLQWRGLHDSNVTGLQLAQGCCDLPADANHLVTVTVPTCGRVAFARLALDLIAGQDYPNLEAIFIDDGKPGQLVEALRDAYDLTVYSKVDSDGDGKTFEATGPRTRAKGLSVVVMELGHGDPLSIGEKRNVAALRARGSVLVHWDDDDIFPPDRVRLQAAPILAGKAQLTILGHSYFGDLPAGAFYGAYTHPTFLGSLAYSRTIALNLGFADVSLGEDLHFTDRALAGCNRLLVVGGVESVYTRHSTQPGARAGPRNSWSWEFVHDSVSATPTTTSKEVNDWIRFRLSAVPSWLSSAQHKAWVAAEAVTSKKAATCSPKELHFPEDFVLQTYPFMPPVCCDDIHDPGCISGKSFIIQQKARRALSSKYASASYVAYAQANKYALPEEYRPKPPTPPSVPPLTPPPPTPPSVPPLTPPPSTPPPSPPLPSPPPPPPPPPSPSPFPPLPAGVKVIQKTATAVSVTIKAEGNVNDYGEGSTAKAKLKDNLAKLFKCFAPGCILTVTVTAASLNINADMVIPTGSSSSAALEQVRAAINDVTPTSASAGLNLPVEAGGISPSPFVQTTVSVAVAPPPPSPSPPPSPPSPPPPPIYQQCLCDVLTNGAGSASTVCVKNENGRRICSGSSPCPGDMQMCSGAATIIPGCVDAKGAWKCQHKFQRKGKCRKLRRAMKKCQKTCGLCGQTLYSIRG
jgi:glycosyltransferase involved in cell wall biosynthesis